MQDLLTQWFPNVMDKTDKFWDSLSDTLLMTVWSGVLAFLIGGILGILVVITRKGGILENAIVFRILDVFINFFRSIPFIILLAGLIGLTRLLMGTAIGVRGAIVPLVFGTAPFYARQTEQALSELDSGLIEAAQSMGTSIPGIVFRVYLRESIASIVRGTTLTVISLIGLTAMAGAVGAGGIGDFAIRYGYNRNQFDVTVVSVITLVLLVGIVQLIGGLIVRKVSH
ncbi:MAG: ABC transporter permease [Oscillospiraceae bacterium]|nr:ABC transporter permease [Oscillospiraceae bacterium]